MTYSGDYIYISYTPENTAIDNALPKVIVFIFVAVFEGTSAFLLLC